MQFKFKSDFALLPMRPSLVGFDEMDIKNEPMLFSASAAYAQQHGGIITNAFLRMLPRDWRENPQLVFDSRVHMLMPGWYPCIPGWHHDDVPRTRVDGQPNYCNPAYHSEHFMMLIGNESTTTFAKGNITLAEVPEGCGHAVYSVWHDEIEAAIKRGQMQEVPVPIGELIHFTCDDFHRGNPATKVGWRWFGRASINTARRHFNEIRHNAQVYLPQPNAGW